MNYKVNLKKKKYTLNEDQKLLLKEAFDLFDMEKTNSIDSHELKLTLKAFGFNIKKDEVLQLINKYSNNNTITYDYFLELMTDKFSERDPKEEALMAFNLFDEEKKGKIGIRQLKKSVKDIGENLSDVELQAIINEFDESGNGEITKEDFLKIMDEYYFD